MKETFTITLLDGIPIASEPDAAAALVRGILKECGRLFAEKPVEVGGPDARPVALFIANTQLGLRLEVHGRTKQEVQARLRESVVTWRAVALHALGSR